MTEFVKNLDLEDLTSFYNRIQKVPNLVAREVTFTINPSVTGGVQEAKKHIMRWAHLKLKYLEDKGLKAYLFTRENHANGWAHLHGIVWFNKENDNSLMLSRPIEMIVKEQGSKYSRKRTLVPQIGRTWVDPLRTESYEKDGIIFNSWFDYICKEQHINWREKNMIYENIDITDFFNIKKDDDFVD